MYCILKIIDYPKPNSIEPTEELTSRLFTTKSFESVWKLNGIEKGVDTIR